VSVAWFSALSARRKLYLEEKMSNGADKHAGCLQNCKADKITISLHGQACARERNPGNASSAGVSVQQDLDFVRARKPI